MKKENWNYKGKNVEVWVFDDNEIDNNKKVDNLENTLIIQKDLEKEEN